MCLPFVLQSKGGDWVSTTPAEWQELGSEPKRLYFFLLLVTGKKSRQEHLNISAFIFHMCNDRHMQNLTWISHLELRKKKFYISSRRFFNLKVRFHCGNYCHHKNVVWPKRFTTFTNGSPIQQDLIPPARFHCDKGIRQILTVLCNGVWPFPELGIKNDYNEKNYNEVSLAFPSIKGFIRKRINISLSFSYIILWFIVLYNILSFQFLWSEALGNNLPDLCTDTVKRGMFF